jgi:hypothetical protein
MYKYRIIVSNSDHYIQAIQPFAHLLNKYWKPNPEVLVVGFTPPDFELPSNFSFYSIGKFEDYPAKNWSDAHIKLLKEIEDEAFVLMLEDYWLTRPVDTNAVQVLVDYAIQFKYVAKIDLCADRLYAHGADLNYGTVSYLDLIGSMPGSPYHLSLMTGVWRREHLLNALRPGWTAHDVELVGTQEFSHNRDVVVLGTRQWPVKHIIAIRTVAPDKLDLAGMSDHDVIEMGKLGLLKPWGINKGELVEVEET